MSNELEGAVRIAIWNAAKSQGMADDAIYPLITKAIAEPVMVKALAFTQEAGWMPIEQRLRKPTDEMWNAAWEASEDYFVADDVTMRGFRLGLSAMIDAALRPLPEIPAPDPHTMDRAGMMQEVEQIAENANCSDDVESGKVSG